MQWRRSEFQKQIGRSWWRHVGFELFGDGKIVGWIIGVIVAITILFWGTVIVVAGHFVSKYW